MLAYSILAFSIALFSAAVSAHSDQAPACFLAAINHFDNPSNIASICKSGISQIQTNIPADCASDQQSLASSAFVNQCSVAGFTVTLAASTTTTSHSSSGSASATDSSRTTTGALSTGTGSSSTNATTTDRGNNTAPVDQGAAGISSSPVGFAGLITIAGLVAGVSVLLTV